MRTLDCFAACVLVLLSFWQGVAHASRACAAAHGAAPAADAAAAAGGSSAASLQLTVQPTLLLPLVSAVALRAAEMSPTAFVDSLAALQQLGAMEAAAAAATAQPAAAASSSSSCSARPYGSLAAAGDPAAADQLARHHICLMMTHLVNVLVTAVEGGESWCAASSHELINLVCLPQPVAAGCWA